MRITDLVELRTNSGKRVAATVHWEDCSRPTQEIYFETDDEHCDGLICSPHAFLVGCLVPAMYEGERRITIVEKVCPELLEGLRTVMAIMQNWYGPMQKPLEFEVRLSSSTRLPRPRYAGSFLSGGVDSLATLRMNRLLYPAEHPRAIQECIIVHGLDMGHENPELEVELFQRAVTAASRPAAEAGARLIPVVTNVRTLNSRVDFWMERFCAAGLASVAHALSGRLTSVGIPSSHDIPNLIPLGTHPLLDPSFSSSDLQIWHDGVRFSRLDKLRVVAQWPVGLANVRVCTGNDSRLLNCGKCEKCIRTMTMLLAIDKLAETPAFPTDTVSAELLSTFDITYEYQDLCYRDIVPLLSRLGRHDLVAIIEDKSASFHRRQKWAREEDWKGAIKRLDRRWLGGSLFRLYAAARHHRQLSITR